MSQPVPMPMESKTEPSQRDPFPQRTSLHPLPRKRSAHAVDLESQKVSYFKIRALVHQLRPQFIEALQTPDFRNCKAAHEIRKQMKVVTDLYKQMVAEAVPKPKLVSECRSLTGEEVSKKVPDLLQPDPLDDCQVKKSYIVGGSPVGWNFITFNGSKAVYYGVTKESYRSRERG